MVARMPTLLLSSCFTMMVWGFEPDEECDRWGNLTMVYDPATEWTWDRVGCRVLLTPPAFALDVLLSFTDKTKAIGTVAADGSVKRFHEWSLAQFIDVACEAGLLKPDVKKFSHGLRDFRNYIHPYQQMVSGFTPDQYTAKVCFQVLKAALASVAGERK